MQNDEWRYGPEGFTRAPEVRALISPYEQAVAATQDPDEDAMPSRWQAATRSSAIVALAMIAAAPASTRPAQEARMPGDIARLPVYRAEAKPAADWLVHAPGSRAAVYRDAAGREIILSNGLIRRSFRLSPNAATVAFFKKHRAILESDVIHLRRADARDLDGILHVNPALPEKGLAMIYNPTAETITKELELPLYYTGLTDTARIREQNGREEICALDREYKVRVKVTVAPGGVTWLVIR